MDKALEEFLTPIVLGAEDFEVVRLERDALVQHWPAMERELERIPQFWSTWWTKEYLLEAGLRGEMQFWAVGPRQEFNFVLITRIGLYPAGSILQSVVGFGNTMELCLPVLFATMQRFAALHSCKSMEIVGRRGWKWMLSGCGFRETATVLTAHVRDLRIN